MKHNKFLFALAASTLILTGCAQTDSPSSSDEPKGDDTSSVVPTVETKTIQELIALMPADGSKSEQRYRVEAKVKTVSKPAYGEMTISDSTGELYVYGTYSADGTVKYADMTSKPVAGDTVVLEANLQLYKGTPELVSAWIISFTHPDTPDIDLNDYADKTIEEARKCEDGAKVHIKDAVVARICYATGKIPCGAMIVDSNSSIYVYGEVAQQLKEGDKVELAAEKTSYILEKERGYAAKYGYKGCNQLENAILISKSSGNDIDLSFAVTKTIKDILNTPVTEDVSTKIYKSTAYITKTMVSGNGGFTNYYLNDLDGTTGTYVYTQASGADYEWMDEFVGKICTVYVSPLNCKSTVYGCAWRFQPIQIKDENYSFDMANATQFALDYYAIDQFENTYVADPTLKLKTSVSNDLLGFNDLKLSYSSSNESVASFETSGEDVIFHSKNTGNATITITASLDGQVSKTATIDIVRKEMEASEKGTVKSAIEAEIDTEVTVEGIVGPSLTVQDGFYLIDETGAIPVTLFDSDAWFAHVTLGQKVILKGNRDRFASSGYAYGNQCISDAKLIYNEYGNYDIPSNSFISTDLEALRAMPVSDDSVTMQVYKITDTVCLTSGNYATYWLHSTSKDSGMQLYSSATSQYNFLSPYVGQTVDMEVALCNWNSKSAFKVSVLSVTSSDGVKVYNRLKFKA